VSRELLEGIGHARLGRMDRGTGRKATNDEKNGGPNLFSPVAWGVVLFSFWISLQAIPGATAIVRGLSWFYFGTSAVLWVSIFSRDLRDLLTRRSLAGFLLPVVFFVSPLAFAIALVQSLGLLEGVAKHLLIAVGNLWMFAYLAVLVRFIAGRVGRIAGIVPSAILIAIGVYTMVRSDLLGGVILVVLGIILVLIAVFRPRIWHGWPF